MVRRLQRQLPFLRSVLREADQNVRRERYQHANADQVNAISELVMNTLKGNVAVPPRLLDQLRPHKCALREMARRKHSIKRRRYVMMAQTVAGVWHALDRVHGPYQKKYLVSPADMERLVEQYKGTLMENSRLAAKQHVLLASPEIPPATKKIRVKALGPEVRRATRRVRTINLPAAGGAAGAGDDAEFAQGPMETLKTLIKSSTPQPKATPKATPKRNPKVPPKPTFSSPTSKSKGTPTLGKGKSPLSVSRPPLTVKKPSRFGQAAKEGKKLAKEVFKLKRQPGWSETTRRRRRRVLRRGYRRRRMIGRGLDIQKWLNKTGIEFHWPGYQYMGPGTHLEKRLKRGDPGINRLDRIAKQHDIDYSRARTIQDKWKADDKMIRAIQTLPGKKTWTEGIVKKIMQAKRKLKL
ncbi:unnamed protein product [Porites evermanni]|uniref:Phospholipase A2-like domain-containing protein n=1 Tax=Porites evermanni TaxID=104178 RepID=A0ABN8QKA1_9CNID|nr:unnamed protein product [Porites evermanni]